MAWRVTVNKYEEGIWAKTGYIWGGHDVIVAKGISGMRNYWKEKKILLHSLEKMWSDFQNILQCQYKKNNRHTVKLTIISSIVCHMPRRYARSSLDCLGYIVKVLGTTDLITLSLVLSL